MCSCTGLGILGLSSTTDKQQHNQLPSNLEIISFGLNVPYFFKWILVMKPTGESELCLATYLPESQCN